MKSKMAALKLHLFTSVYLMLRKFEMFQAITFKIVVIESLSFGNTSMFIPSKSMGCIWKAKKCYTLLATQ